MKENNCKATALHHASYYGHKEIIKLLLNVFGSERREKFIN